MYAFITTSFVFALLVIMPFVASAAVTLPSFPQPSGSEIVGKNFQNPTSVSVPSHPVQFGQALVRGELSGTSGVAFEINGNTVPAQIDVKTKHSDGSVKFGVVTVMAPALAGNSTNPSMLSPGTKGTALSLSSMPGYSFNIAINLTGTISGNYNFDVPTLLAQALAANKVSYWRQGAVVTEGRIDVPVTCALHLVIDIAKYADGTYSTDVNFNNDYTMTSCGDTLSYTTTITSNGTPTTLTIGEHFQYQNWHRLFRSSGNFWIDGKHGISPINVQHDIAYLKKTGAIQQYDLTTGVNPQHITEIKKNISCGDWSAPFGNASYYQGDTCVKGNNPYGSNGITKYMPMTGGRPDIGPTTMWNTIWLMTQDPSAAKFALYQGDTAANIPWQHFDKANNTWLNVDNYPNLWTDGRGGVGTPGDPQSGGLTQQYKSGGSADGECCTIANGWSTDTAHQPSLSFIPYLLTGNRFNLDQLNAVASWNIMSIWPSGAEYGYARFQGEGLLLTAGANQVRGGAWAFREVLAAAWGNPDSTTEKTYFTKIVNNNINYLLKNYPQWKIDQGEAYGLSAGALNQYGGMAPWQHDFLLSTLVFGSQLGFTTINPYLEYAANWHAGRFLSADKGFSPRNGAVYQLTRGSSQSEYFKTWKAINDGSVAAGQTNGPNDWNQSGGYYGILAHESNASLMNTIGSADAARAYAWLKSVELPGTDLQGKQNDPTFNIASNGSVFVPGTPATPIPTPTTPPTTTGKQICVGSNCSYSSVASAFSAATNGSTITISGEWNQGGALLASNVTIKGTPGAHLKGGAVQGKAIMVIQGDNTIVENLECSEATVADENGACIRQEGNNLTLKNVNFHDNENGILTLSNVGLITIDGSTFERNGMNGGSGYSHGIYVGGGDTELVIKNSKFLRSKLGGHEIKSRAAKTTIENSTIATLDGVDSRNIDIPNGGVVVIKNNVIQHGPNAENNNSIGIGLEGMTRTNNSILIDSNYIILERAGSNVMLETGSMPTPTVTNNIIIGGTDPGGSNKFYSSRSAADIAAYPYLPSTSIVGGTDTPTPTPTPSPTTPGFSVGDRIVLNTGTNVRGSANGVILGTQQYGALGLLTAGPISAGGYNWWNVNYDTGLDGFSVDMYMDKSSTPAPTPIPTPTPAPTPTPDTTAPVGYSKCADEDEICSFSGTASVLYGANGTYKNLTLTGGTTCTNAVFGDPVIGTIKACYYKLNDAPTPTPTPIPTPTPTPTTYGVGSQIKVALSTSVYSRPSRLRSSRICTQTAGAVGTISGGPRELSGQTWWKINFTSRCDGWVKQSNLTLQSTAVSSGGTSALSSNTIGSTALVQAVRELNVRSSADTFAKILCTQNAGQTGSLLGGPQRGGGYSWWNVNFTNGCDGWAADINLKFTTTSLQPATIGALVASANTVPSTELFTKNLSQGTKGADVRRLQFTLKVLGLFNDEISGSYGPLTTKAVAAFQKNRGLVANGNVDTETRNVLNWQ